MTATEPQHSLRQRASVATLESSTLRILLNCEPILDFLSDIRDYFVDQFSRLGYVIDGEQSVGQLGAAYFSLVARLISAQPRTVLESAEFSCPDELRVAYGALKEKIQLGENVNPFLSELLLKLDYQDHLLWDWGIHHFHLAQVLNEKGFVKRGNPLLYARVENDKFYSIQISDHAGFSKQEMMRIVHRNWPATIEQWRVKGALGLAQNLSDQEVKTLRTAGVQSLIEVGPGVVYYSPGGGLTTAGTSTKAQLQCMHWLRILQELEKWMRSHPDEVRQTIRNMSLIAPDPLRFKLLVKIDGFYAREVQCGTEFLLYRLGNT